MTNPDMDESIFEEEETRLWVVPSTSLRLEAVPAQASRRRSIRTLLRLLLSSRGERALVSGCRELSRGNDEEARRHLQRATHLPDGAFILGFLALRDDRLEEAEQHLRAAAEAPGDLGSVLGRHNQTLSVQLPTGPDSSVSLESSLRGALLGLIEICRRQGRAEEAALLRMRLRQEVMPDSHGEISGTGR